MNIKHAFVFAVCFASLLSSCDDKDSNKAKCGNNILEGNEICDGPSFAEGISCDIFIGEKSNGSIKCTNTCEIDTSECTKAACNHDGKKDDAEECDGTDFGAQTCASIDPQKPAGALKCSDACTIDTSECKKASCNHDGKKDDAEECDGTDFGAQTCASINPDKPAGALKCSDACTIDTSECTKSACNHDGKKDDSEECDGADFGNQTCATFVSGKPYGQLGCTDDCRISTHYCAADDLGLQAPYPDVEQTDAQCSDGENNFKTVDKNGKPSTWVDCKNHGCLTSPLVQVCSATENSNAACSDKTDNATADGMPSGMSKISNGLIDCADPSCFKNWRVTVCESEAPRWELGESCKDGADNDGDTLADCDDPDCLHAGNPCDLGGRSRILFDNAHHQIAGAVDWIIDVTGRHPFPSKPEKENDWHGSLSSWGKDLLDSGKYIVETLPQNRRFTYGDAAQPQDLKHYDILVSVEPSSKFTTEEITAIHDFVKNGGGLILFADHKGADRDGNGVDAVDAINGLLSALPGASTLESNPFGFHALSIEKMSNDTAVPAEGAPSALVNGVVKTGSYAGTAFEITDTSKAVAVLKTQKDSLNYAVAVQYEKGRIIAIGDSSIAGDGTNFLGISLSNKNAYNDANLSNRTFLLNTVDWVRSAK